MNLKEQNLQYLQFLWNKKAFIELMLLKVFPDPKEVTESVASYFHIQNHLKIHPGDDKTVVFVVGDGSYPRTAALLAKISNWTTISIDPAMQKCIQKSSNIQKKIDKLSFVPDFIENYQLSQELLDKFDKAVVLMIHSHADNKITFEKTLVPFIEKNKTVGIIDIPCCFHKTFCSCSLQFSDEQILSSKNQVFVYTNETLKEYYLKNI